MVVIFLFVTMQTSDAIGEGQSLFIGDFVEKWYANYLVAV